MQKFLYTLFVSLLFTACNRVDQDTLNGARSYLHTNPDSTLICLEGFDPSGLDSKSYMEYLLILTQARDKTQQDISNDTLLFAYKDQFRKFPDQKAAWFYFYIGKIYYLQGNTSQALSEYMECEKLLTQDLYLTGLLKSAYAEAHMDKFELEEAILYYKHSAEIFEKTELWTNASICYNKIANCFLYEHQLDSVFYYYDKCFQYQSYWKPDQEAVMITNLGLAYSESGDNHTAIQLLEQALSLPVNNYQKAQIYLILAHIHSSEPIKFQSYIQQGIDLLLGEENNSLLLSQFYNQLSKYHTNKDNPVLALEYKNKYCEYLISAIDTKYDTSLQELKQEIHIRHLHTQNLQLIITRQRIQLILLIVCLSATAIIFIISRRFKRKKQELWEAEQKIDTLQDMASLNNCEKNSLRDIVLQHFNLLKKVAQLQAVSSTKNHSKTIVKKFNHIVYAQDTMDWEIFYSTINTAYNNLCDRIRNKFPDLKDNEFKVICLTIAKFSNPEIAVILNKSPHTIPGIKSQIRKKVGITEQGNIAEFFLHCGKKDINQKERT
ncbi:MAG: tetratricopeptide repeat protein [Bacteroides sp.]|nr:tetratricopeptide repeat protein [Bacteroides sp.]